MHKIGLIFLCCLLPCSLIYSNHPVRAKTDQAVHNYLYAAYAQQRGDLVSAHAHYKELLKMPEVFEFYPGYLEFLMQSGATPTIIKLLPEADPHVQDNITCQLIFVQALLKEGKIAAAGQKILTLCNQFPDNPEVIYAGARVLFKQGKPNKALELLKDYLDTAPETSYNFLFNYLSAQILVKEKLYNQASQKIELCLTQRPHFAQGWLLSGVIAELNGEKKQALDHYMRCKELSDLDPRLEYMISSLQNDSHQPLNDDHLTKARNYLILKKYRTAQIHAIKALNQKPDDLLTRLFTLHILHKNNDYETLLYYLKQWLSKNPDQEIWYKACCILFWVPEQRNHIVNIMKEHAKYHPHNVYAHLYLADIFLKQKEWILAAQNLNQCAALTKNPQTKAKIYLQQAFIAFHTSNYQQIPFYLNKIEKDRMPAAGYNLAAFYYATKGRDIKRAQEYCNKARALEPYNPHFLDTQALIYLKQEDLEPARTLLETIVINEPDDYYIHLHLAKIRIKEGRFGKAQEELYQALRCATKTYEREKCHKLLAKCRPQHGFV